MFLKDLRKFIFKISLFAPISLGVMGINYAIDPAHIYPQKIKGEFHRELREKLQIELSDEPLDEYVLGIADYLLHGLNVAHAANYDQRLLQRYYILGSDEKKEIIVLGSCRSWEINTKIFPKKSFFNHGVSAATIEDFLAIYNMYHDKRLTPETIVLGIDPWIFQRNEKVKWKSIKKEYDVMINKLKEFAKERKDQEFQGSFVMEWPWANGARVFFLEKYFQLFSPSYFQSSLKELVIALKENKAYLYRGKFLSLFSQEQKNPLKLTSFKYNVGSGSQSSYFPTQEEQGDYDIILTDGSLNFPKRATTQAPDEILKEVKKVVSQGWEPNLGSSFKEMDSPLREQFETFVDFLKEDKIKIIIFLPPFHPYFYDHMVKSKQFDGVIEVENYLKDFAKKRRIKLIGSYNPYQCLLEERDFVDYLHAKRKLVERIFFESLTNGSGYF